MLVFYRAKSGKIVCFDNKKKIIRSKASQALKDSYKEVKVKITKHAIEHIKEIKPKAFDELDIKRINKLHKDLLNYSMTENKSMEVACCMRLNSKKRSKFFKGDTSSVPANVQMLMILRMSNKNSLVMVHNHPSGSNRFSLKDLKTFAKFKSIKTMSVVTNDGKVSYISKLDNFNRKEFLKEIRKQTKRVKNKEIKKKQAVDFLLKNMYSSGIDGEWYD